MRKQRWIMRGILIAVVAWLGSTPTAGKATVTSPAAPVNAIPGGSGPGQPLIVRVGELALGPATAVAVSGTLALVGITDTLTLVDISAPAAPTVLGRVLLNTPMLSDPALTPPVTSVAISGTTAYVTTAHQASTASLRGALTIIDVADAAHPTILGVLGGDEAGWSRTEVNIAGRSAYVSTYALPQPALEVVDITNPLSPTTVATAAPSFSRGLAVAGDTLYLARGRLEIWNIADPRQPTLTGIYTPTAGLADIEVRGATAYGVGSDTFQTIDVSVPTAPQPLGSVAISATLGELAVAEPFAFVSAADQGIAMIDSADPAAPQVVARYHSTGAIQEVAPAGDLLLAANRDRGLEVLRVVEIRSIQLLPVLSR